MKQNLNEIKTGIGLGDLKFGMLQEDVLKILGKPDEKEKFSYTDDDQNFAESWHYDEKEISLGFDEEEGWKLVTISVTAYEYEFHGKKLIGMKKQELEAFLKDLGVEEIDYEDNSTEDNPNSELIFCDELGMNFWCEDDFINEVQWGPLFIDEDTIKWPE